MRAGKFDYTCDLLSWTYVLEGWRLSVAPDQVSLAMARTGPGNTAAATVALGEYVGEVTNIRLLIQYDPRLSLEASDIATCAASSKVEATFDLNTPGQVSLLFAANNAIRGSASMATLNFHLPKEPVADSYYVTCGVVEATGPGGLIDIGGQNLTIDGAQESPTRSGDVAGQSSKG